MIDRDPASISQSQLTSSIAFVLAYILLFISKCCSANGFEDETLKKSMNWAVQKINALRIQALIFDLIHVRRRFASWRYSQPVWNDTLRA